MAALGLIDGIETFIRQRIVVERRSYEYVSEELRQAHPTAIGISARSIRRFCADHDIHGTSRLSDNHLDEIVAASIGKVGLNSDSI